MSIELINERHIEHDGYEIDFQQPETDVSGTIVVEGEPTSEGRYKMGINLRTPLPGQLKILSESRERHMAGIKDDQQLAAWINLAVTEVRTRYELNPPRQV